MLLLPQVCVARLLGEASMGVPRATGYNTNKGMNIKLEAAPDALLLRLSRKPSVRLSKDYKHKKSWASSGGECPAAR
jgi:hypothetical protein